jgi:hypothetical protein
MGALVAACDIMSYRLSLHASIPTNHTGSSKNYKLFEDIFKIFG